MFPFNQFDRSGFVNMTQDPHWNFGGGVKAGHAVALDEAPEVGCLILSSGPATTNHVMWFDVPEDCIEEDVPLTVSFIVKPVLMDYVYIRENANTEGKSERTYFDVANLRIGKTSNKHSGAFIKDLGNGVVRVGVTFTPTDTDAKSQREITLGIAAIDGSNVFSADAGAELCVFFHAQMDDSRNASKPVVSFPGK